MSTNGCWEIFPFKGDVSGRLAGEGRRAVSIKEERVVPASILSITAPCSSRLV
jgi:hypothetical protein